jgi:hypothetical protein
MPRLRALCEQELRQTSEFLNKLAASNERLSRALKRPELVNGLEESLTAFVTLAVNRDLRRLRQTKTLFWKRKREQFPPPIFSKLDPADVDNSITKTEAYNRYLDWYIDPPAEGQGGERDQKGRTFSVRKFYERYPLVDHAVETITNNYKSNIELACGRILANWGAIQNAFFPDNSISYLIKIQTTGSDSHKGGKQVLILTFQCEDGVKGRVVYKPSAVEIDCRIVGDSSIFSRVRPDGYWQEKSLTELINGFAGAKRTAENSNFGYARPDLPTYKILPYSNQSVPNAYGYIEFLTHKPEIPADTRKFEKREQIDDEVRKNVKGLSVDVMENSDWIAKDRSDELVFYHAWGELMAIALAISLCDLHGQNMIVHRRLPHLIDLEEALKKPMRSVKETYLNQWFNVTYDPGSPEFVVRHEGTIDRSGFWQPGTANSPAKGILYKRSGDPVLLWELGQIEPDRLKALVQGFTEVIEILAMQKHNDAVKVWVRGLEHTIARYVVVATATLAADLRGLYEIYCESSCPVPEKPRSYDEFNYPGPDGTTHFFRTKVEGARNAQPQNDPWQGLPKFAIEHPNHAWRDYFNCDVPSFYHELGSRTLLNSRGDAINVAQVSEWQETNVGANIGNVRPNPNYFPNPSISVVTSQVDNIKTSCATSPNMRRYLRNALKEALGNPPRHFENILRSLV